jgi:hypothetical protein
MISIGSNDLNELAVFKHAHYPAATVVEKIKGFAGQAVLMAMARVFSA